MKLDVMQPKLNSQSHPLTSCRITDRYLWERELQPNMWVHLLKLPSAFSFDEALLLCKYSESEWVAWIPEHGEAVLHESQFF